MVRTKRLLGRGYRKPNGIQSQNSKNEKAGPTREKGRSLNRGKSGCGWAEARKSHRQVSSKQMRKEGKKGRERQRRQSEGPAARRDVQTSLPGERHKRIRASAQRHTAKGLGWEAEAIGQSACALREVMSKIPTVAGEKSHAARNEGRSRQDKRKAGEGAVTERSRRMPGKQSTRR